MIGPFCFITDSDHQFSLDAPIPDQDMKSEPTVIGNGVWIGAGAKILKGVNIGDGAVIGAGSVITRDVESFTIVAGVPGRQIGVRR